MLMDVLRIYDKQETVNMFQCLESSSQKQSECALWRNVLIKPLSDIKI